MLIGYARVSTAEQTLDLQLDHLRQAGCERFYQDVASGAKTARPGLDAALAYARASDQLVVWKLDRLGRSLHHLIAVVKTLDERGVGFRSLTESIDTTTTTGRLIFHIFASLAEFERDLILERTHAGLTSARARGRVGGRPKKLTAQKLQSAQTLYDNGQSISAICATLGISRPTLYRSISRSNSTIKGAIAP